MGIKYPTTIHVSLGYHNLKLDEQFYLTAFSYPFGRYRYIWLPFWVASTGYMFQRKIDELFHELHNIFGIVDDILLQVSMS